MDNQKTNLGTSLSDKQGKKQKPIDELKKIRKDHKSSEINELELIKTQNEKLKQIGDEYKTKYLRALADYQNLENRIAGHNQQFLKTANSQLLLKLLPFLDSLDKAEVFVKDAGLKIVKDQFQKTLFDSGLQEIEVLNKQYDPYTAEVVDMVSGEVDNQVVEVVRKGYKFHDSVLRVAQVKVSKKPITN